VKVVLDIARLTPPIWTYILLLSGQCHPGKNHKILDLYN